MRAALAALLLTTAAPVAAAGEWYVVVASYRVDDAAMRDQSMRMEAAARRCHVEVFNDFSMKFEGFQPGYNVFVVGPYASKAKAGAVLSVARPCFPSAYVKSGRYLGE